MKSAIIEGANGVMTGDPETEVGNLHFLQEVDAAGICVRISAWTPTPNELADLAAGANVHVAILGKLFPPIAVGVGEPPHEDPVPIDGDGSIQALVRALRSHAVAMPGCGQSVVSVSADGQIATRYNDVRMTGLHIMFAVDVMIREALGRLPPEDHAGIGPKLKAARAALGLEGFWNDERGL